MLLLTPTTLLQKLTLARPNGLSSPAITSDEATPEAWLALQHPEKFLDEGARQGFYKEKQDIESRFTNVHRVARMQLPDMFPAGQRPTSFGRTLRFFCDNPLSFFSLAATLYEGVRAKALDLDGMRDLFTCLPEWPLYLAEWAQGMRASAARA